MSQRKGTTKRYCSDCHTQHGFRRECHEASKTKSTRSTRSTKLKRKRDTYQSDFPEICVKTFDKKAQKTPPFMTVCPSCPSCPVCLEVRGKQKKLGCGHQLCFDCYASISKNEEGSRCPLCRADMFRGKSGTYRMKPNHGQRTVTLVEELRFEEVSDDDVDDDYDEMDLETQLREEREWVEIQEQEEASDQFVLTFEVAPDLKKWKELGGDLISHELEVAAKYLVYKEDFIRDRAWGEQMLEWITCAEFDKPHAEVICRLMDNYGTLNSVSPPKDPYGPTGLILGELRRVFGYSSWVTTVDLDVLQPKEPMWVSDVEEGGVTMFRVPSTEDGFAFKNFVLLPWMNG